jgi:hypothetical protein
MQNRANRPNIPHPKRRGEWAELRFQLRATELGLILARPCGDCAPYDFIVACPERPNSHRRACPARANSDRRDHHAHFLRVQVKCTIYHRANSYKCHLDHNGIPYTPDQIDFFAAYVIPADTFYILPLPATNHQPDILLSPHLKNSKYSLYKEAWHLLMQAT